MFTPVILKRDDNGVSMTKSSAADVFRSFYAARTAQDAERLRPFIDADVVWREPPVGLHMRELRGVDAVVHMIA